MQGVGSPVPAAGEGVQAGPPSSRSSYRSGMEVDPLAPMSSNTTRMNPTELAAFAKNSKVQRSPTGIPTQPAAASAELIDDAPTFSTPEGSLTRMPTRSPSEQFILRMRKKEEEALRDIKKVLKAMKAAMVKQKNINTNVKEGVLEIDELLCIAETSRSSWLRVETENCAKAKKTKIISVVDTPLTTKAKRNAESPAEKPEDTKRSRERSPSAKAATVTSRVPLKTQNEWKEVRKKKPKKNRGEENTSKKKM